MAKIDVFNGDADGICALAQIRNATPAASRLVTGVKRDIELLERVEAGAGDEVTVLDVSLDKNRDGLERILERGARVLYVDHHFAGEIPRSQGLTALIDTDPNVCTSILVDRHLQGRVREWAVVGAFGDNLKQSALDLARPLALPEAELQRLETLGTYLNYNGYGESVEDLHFAPDALFGRVRPFASPFTFMSEDREGFGRLEAGYRDDMAVAQATRPARATRRTAVFILPDEPWARRVSGVYGNDLANQTPARGHAVLTAKRDGTYLVSVRAPLDDKTGADELCRRFPTGGGRQAAAGINALPADRLEAFLEQFAAFYA